MARNVVSRGHDVLAFDVRERPLQQLVQQGGRCAKSLTEIGASCEHVLVMVVNGEQVKAVLADDGVLLDTIRVGIVVVHATIALSGLRRSADIAKISGVTLIDCPVSGGAVGAHDGTLTMLCGGDVRAFEQCRDPLEAVSSNITHLGPLGAGMVGELACNLILGVGRLAIGDAFAMARRAGLDTDTLYETLTTCTADSRQ